MLPRTTRIDPAAAAEQRTEALETIDRLLAEAGAPTREQPAAERGPCLVVSEGGERRLVPLTRRLTHIGRGFGVNLQLEDPGVSRRHAIVVRRPGETRILDDRSANGTWVNGRRVVDAVLRDGDVITLGRTALVYVDDGAAPARDGERA